MNVLPAFVFDLLHSQSSAALKFERDMSNLTGIHYGGMA
jgi:hypothetical protein